MPLSNVVPEADADRYRQQNMNAILANQIVQHFNKLTANLVESRRNMTKAIDDGRRNLFKECGYPETSQLRPENYKNQFDRNPIAARVVECFPSECWLKPPTIFETLDPDRDTQFEKDWDALGKELHGPSWYEEEEGSAIWSEMRKLDILSGIGHFGIMLLGIDDGRDLVDPVQGFENGWPKEPSNEKRKLLYLTSFDQTLVEIETFDEDDLSPRCGYPLTYSVTFSDPSEPINTGGATTKNQVMKVHWSRVLHVADNYNQPCSSPIFAPPRMRSVYNRCMDADKLFGGGAEGTWRGAFPGLSIESHPQLGGDIAFDAASVRAAVERYTNTLQRFLAIEGASVKSLMPQVNDPTNQINGIIDAICIKLEIPKRIFVGSERGELASSEDKGTWRERKRGRQSNHLTPNILVPFVDRMILYGCVSSPEKFYCQWPSSGEMDDMEKANLAVKRTEALARYVTGGVDVMISPLDYLTHIIGYEEEEARHTLDHTADYLDDQNPDAEMDAVPGRDPAIPVPEELDASVTGAKKGIEQSASDRLRSKFAPNPTQQPKGKIDAEKGKKKPGE